MSLDSTYPSDIFFSGILYVKGLASYSIEHHVIYMCIVWFSHSERVFDHRDLFKNITDMKCERYCRKEGTRTKL